MRAAARVGLACWLAGLAGGCEGLLPGPDFERMIDQAKAKPYAVDPLVPGAPAMRSPPEGTVRHAGPDARRRRADHPELDSGIGAQGEPLARVPLPVTYALLARGRQRFEIHCATCHGVRGDGESEVARHMDQRKPPDLLSAGVRAFSDGRIFRVIGAGYGLMPAYGRELAAEERWAVVAYLRALELSQAVRLDALPPELRRAAERALP
ncbi:MAG TPA: cytochrome c [Polyangia bacterium]